MGSIFVGVGTFGFWCNDGHLELLLHLLSDEIERLEDPEPWLTEARIYWRAQSWMGVMGGFSPDLNRFAGTEERASRLLQLVQRVQEALITRKGPLSDVSCEKPRRGQPRAYVGDIPTEWFLQVVEAYRNLLKGEMRSTATTSPVLPHLPQYQEWAYVDHDQAMIYQYWVQLEREQYRTEPGESAIDRLLVSAWESKDPRIKAA